MIDTTDMATDKLFTRYANACATSYGAMGHSKTHYNEVYAKCYAAELKSRGEDVPEMKVAAKFGGFNGEGSY